MLRTGEETVRSEASTASKRLTVAFGPQLQGIGSWEWVGADLAAELAGKFQTLVFDSKIPRCDLAVVVKYDAADIIAQIPADVPIVFCPVDCYGSSAEIDRDWRLLRRCARIVVHAEPLGKYFRSYAPVNSLDHHLKFAAPLRETFRSEGPILWAGMRSNLPPVVEWVNRNGLPAELVVLTNLEPGEPTGCPERFGFRPGAAVRVESWSAQKHLSLTAEARAAIDVKGDDFRQRHKPPAKALDFIASGLPLAMNRESSSSRHLRRLGFELAVPEEPQRWLSHEYWEETRRIGAVLRQRLSRKQVAERLGRILDDVLAERGRAR